MQHYNWKNQCVSKEEKQNVEFTVLVDHEVHKNKLK